MTIADAPWPGLTPDLLSVMLVVATQAKGSVLIHQKMFESRLFFVDKLIDMGGTDYFMRPSPCGGNRSRPQFLFAGRQYDFAGYSCRYCLADCGTGSRRKAAVSITLSRLTEDTSISNSD